MDGSKLRRICGETAFERMENAFHPAWFFGHRQSGRFHLPGGDQHHRIPNDRFGSCCGRALGDRSVDQYRDEILDRQLY